MWLLCSPTGVQPFGFASPQFFRVYLWQTYVPPGDTPWPMPGVATSSTALNRGQLLATLSAVVQPFHQYGMAYRFWGSAK